MQRQVYMAGKVWTEFRERPELENRKYTVTHSDTTGDLFVTIGSSFARDLYSDMRDEVLFQWVDLDGVPVLVGKVLVSGEGIEDSKGVRRQIFMREFDKAVVAVRQGDQGLFQTYPELNQAPVLVYFQEDGDGSTYRFRFES